MDSVTGADNEEEDSEPDRVARGAESCAMAGRGGEERHAARKRGVEVTWFLSFGAPV